MRKFTVLEDPFIPSDLPPGYYTAYSDTPAYPTLWGMVRTGWAHDEGERFLEGGVVQMVASVDMPPLSPNPGDNYEEAMVIIPHSAFTKVINDYGEWRQMWWREVIQNSIDAGAKTIDCRIEEQDDGTWKVSCRDDGHGMSYETLMNAFFTVGGTEKSGVSQGGFGEAKKLIALAWIEYAVHTRDIRVEGTGAEFPKLKVYRDVETIRGTSVEVVMPADKHTTEAAAIEYISRCYLPGVKFFVNGTPVQANLRRGRKKRDLPFGTEVFYNKDIKGLHGILVRSNGLYMFSKDLSTDFEGVIVVEVYPRPREEGGPSVDDLFLSNRMELQYGELRDAVHKIYTEADFDLKQALRAPDSLFREKYKGTGYFTTETARNREAMVRQEAGALPEVSGGAGLEITSDMLKTLVELFGKFERQAVNEAGGDAASLVGVVSEEEAELLLGMNYKGESHLEAGIQQLIWQPDFININDETTRSGFRLDKKFRPSHMTGPVFSIARLWAAYVRTILIKMGSTTTWGVGFVFSNEAQGMFYTDTDGGKWIVLNPINLSTGKLMSIRDKSDVRLIFEVAMHECAHLLGGSYHGDGFIRAFDSIVREMLAHWGEAKRIARGIKVRGVIKKKTGFVTPERTKLFVVPMAEKLTRFEVQGDDSLKSLSESLDMEERQLYFYLADDELDDFYYNYATSEEREISYSGEVFSIELSYPLVRRFIKESLFGDLSRYPRDVIPVRVFLMSDNSIWLEPDSPSHRQFYKEMYRISEVSTRVQLTDGSELEEYLRKVVLDNYELKGWPYNTKNYNPEDVIRELYRDRDVLIPLETSIYNRVIDNFSRYDSHLMNKVESIAINVTKDGHGHYRLHPDINLDFELYRVRFDAHYDYFEIVLNKKHEKELLDQQLSSVEITDINNGYSTRVIIPTKLFERFIYNHEYDIRRKDWSPMMPDAIKTLVSGNIQVIARNFGSQILLLEFSGPYEVGVRLAEKYKTTPSELMWFVDYEDADALTAQMQTESLRAFWKECTPGYMLVNLDLRRFEQGIASQCNKVVIQPKTFMPTWIMYYKDEDYFVITPVIYAHKRFFPNEVIAVKNDNYNRDVINGFIHSTYNCGVSIDGNKIAMDLYDRLISEHLPVMVSMATDLFARYIEEGSW